MPATATAAPPLTADDNLEIRRWMFILGAGFFSTVLPQTQVAVTRLPLQHVLKDELHYQRTAMAAFFALASMAWNFKPFAGILTDSFPLFGTRRRHYLIVSMGLAALLWLATALVPRQYTPLLWMVVAINVCLVFGSTVTGGLMVQAGQRFGATGRLSAARFFVSNACVLAAGPIGGYLASHGFTLTTAVAAACAFAVVPVAFFYLREPDTAARNTDALRTAGRQLKVLVKSGTLWSAAGMLFLVYISPGFSTPLYFYQTDTLHFSQQYIGLLGMVTGGAGILGAVAYGAFCRRFRLRPLLALGLTLMASATLAYLRYRTRSSALVIEAVVGLVSTLAELPLMDLAARATPRGSEGLGFALMMSVRNGALALSDVIGSRLADRYHWSFSSLVWLNAGTTALCLLAVPLLPGAITDRRDGDAAPAEAKG
jgi:predicted MFS family arabinose efflux permease